MALKKTIPVAAGVAAVASVMGPAFANLPYTVSVDGDTSGTTHDVTAVSKGPVVITIGPVITCDSVMLEGFVNTGTVQSPTPPIAEFTSSTWSGCSYTGSGSGSASMSQSSTWALNGDGDNSSTPGVDNQINSALSVTGSQASISGPIGTCTFSVTGGIDAYLDESAGPRSRQELVIPGTGSSLTASNVTFACFGMVNNGDAVDIAGSFVLAFSTDFNVWE